MRLFSFLNTKTVSVICLSLAVACRITNVLFVSFIGRDKIILMQQSRNFIEGKGLSLTRYFIQNTDTPVYDFTPFWPPGYPILLAPFLKIVDYDVYWATTLLDLLFAVAFIFLVRKIVVEIGFPMSAVNIMTIVAGCFDYAFIYKSLPTDIPAFTFFLGGLILLMQVVKKNSYSGWRLLMVSIFLLLPCTFRYSYPPLTIAAPIALIFLGWYLKRKLLIKAGLTILLVCSILIITFLVALKSLTGHVGYIVDTGRGFFPENFLHWAPFFIGSFINIIFTTSQLINNTGISLAQSLKLLDLINAVLFVTFICLYVFLFFKKKFFKSANEFRIFLVVGFFICAATWASLSYLSLTYRPQPGWGNYLGEPRYFMFVNLYLQIAFLGWVFIYSSWKKSLLQKAIVFIFSLILFIEISHNIYFNAKVIISPGKYVAPEEEPDYVYFISAIDSIAKEDRGGDIWVVSDKDDFFPMLTNYLGYKGIFDGYNMLKALPAVKKKTILILPLYDLEMEKFKPFLAAQNAKFMNRVAYVNFYRIELLP